MVVGTLLALMVAGSNPRLLVRCSRSEPTPRTWRAGPPRPPVRPQADTTEASTQGARRERLVLPPIERFISGEVTPFCLCSRFSTSRANQIFPDPSNAPTWAKTGHRVGATVIAGVFTSNTITGLWNLWDSRAVEDRRVLRYAPTRSRCSQRTPRSTYAGIDAGDPGTE